MVEIRNSGKKPASLVQGDLLRKAISWVLDDDQMFADLKKHGNASWSARSLVMLACLTGWSEATQMTRAFEKAASLMQSWYGELTIATYQGMMRALAVYSSQLLPRVWTRLQHLMEGLSGNSYRINGWLPLAVDGSRFTTPRSASNEKAFAAENFGSGKEARSRVKWKDKTKRSKKLCRPVQPQIWMTLIWHMGLKLPWCWKTGPSTSSERHHLIEMIHSFVFPEKTLFCCDAGFVGYELWSSMIQENHSFLIRVGGNVRLLRKLGHARCGDGIVYLWPDAAARKKQPPLVLRLMEIKNSRGSMFLVTNILSKRSLSDAAIAKLYPLRWGVELQFRATKQTFSRCKLRSRNAAHALAELDWSMVALTMIQLFAVAEQVKIEEPPARMSVSAALRAVRDAMSNWREPVCHDRSLKHQLQQAVIDTYHRASQKQARYNPDYKDKPKATAPIIRNATDKQRRQYRALQVAT